MTDAAPMPGVVAHRGACGSAPENTLAAFARAADLGARWVELDVRRAACGTLIVMHDATVDRTTDGQGRVCELDLGQLQRLDAGAWWSEAFRGEPVPTLADVFALARARRLGLNLEIKADTDEAAATGAAVARVLLKKSDVPTLVSSFSRAALEACRRVAPDARIGFLCGYRLTARELATAEALVACSLHAHRNAWDEASVRKVGDRGLWPTAYTVNDGVDARRLWGRGVGTIITDHPERLLPSAPDAGLSSDG